MRWQTFPLCVDIVFVPKSIDLVLFVFVFEFVFLNVIKGGRRFGDFSLNVVFFLESSFICVCIFENYKRWEGWGNFICLYLYLYLSAFVLVFLKVIKGGRGWRGDSSLGISGSESTMLSHTCG